MPTTKISGYITEKRMLNSREEGPQKVLLTLNQGSFFLWLPVDVKQLVTLHNLSGSVM